MSDEELYFDPDEFPEPRTARSGKTPCLKPGCHELVDCGTGCWCWEHVSVCDPTYTGCSHGAHFCEEPVHYCEEHAP